MRAGPLTWTSFTTLDLESLSQKNKGRSRRGAGRGGGRAAGRAAAERMPPAVRARGPALPPAAMPELDEFESFFADTLGCSAPPLQCGGRAPGQEEHQPGQGALPERMRALELTAAALAKLPSDLDGGGLGTIRESQEWAPGGLKRGGSSTAGSHSSLGGGGGGGPGSVVSSSSRGSSGSHSSVASASRVYGRAQSGGGSTSAGETQPQQQQPVGLDNGSEERARRISAEFWKWAGCADTAIAETAETRADLETASDRSVTSNEDGAGAGVGVGVGAGAERNSHADGRHASVYNRKQQAGSAGSRSKAAAKLAAARVAAASAETTGAWIV
eukprot:SAG22_NODE_4485_length_1255_cov_1.282872_1_plen_329_part_10